MGNDDNLLTLKKLVMILSSKLFERGYIIGEDFEVMLVPNIVDISYGRGVGYTFTEHNLGEQIHSISATQNKKGDERKW